MWGGLECRGESERWLSLLRHSEGLRCDSDGSEGFEQVKNGKLESPHASFISAFTSGNAKPLAPQVSWLGSETSGQLRLSIPCFLHLGIFPCLFPPLRTLFPLLLTNLGPTFLPEISLVFMMSRSLGGALMYQGSPTTLSVAGLSASSSQPCAHRRALSEE